MCYWLTVLLQYSLRQTILFALKRAIELKKTDPFSPVTILTPNKEVTTAVNRVIQQQQWAFTALYIETMEQHIYRVTENLVYASKKNRFEFEDRYFIIQKLVNEGHFQYYQAAGEFKSYAYYFTQLVQELRLTAEDKIISRALRSLPGSEAKGAELAQVYRAYVRAKGDDLDYADLCQVYHNPDESVLVLPLVFDELKPVEKAALDNLWVEEIEWQEREEKPALEIKNPLYGRLELREAIKEILQKNQSFDQSVLIVPPQMVEAAMAECLHLGVNARTGEGAPAVLPACRQFVAILDIIESDFSYQSLKQYLLLSRSYARLRHLAKAGIGSGLEEILSALYAREAELKEKKRQSESLEQLVITLEHLRRCLELKNDPGQMAEHICEHLVMKSKATFLIRQLAQNYRSRYQAVSFDAWAYFMRDHLLRIRDEEEITGAALLVTSEHVPGVFDYVYFAGLSSENFPRRYRENPLLLDPEREFLNQQHKIDLQLSADRNNRATSFIEEVLTCCEQAFTGYYPAIDAIDGTQKFASFSLMGVASEVTGARLTVDAWQKFKQEAVLPAFAQGASDCLNNTDWQKMYLLNRRESRTRMAAHVLAENGQAAGYLESYRDFWQPGYNRRSGLVGKDLLDLTRAWSVTSDFERFMGCQYRWYLERHLRIAEFEEPELLDDIDALTRGMLLHEVFEEALAGGGELQQVIQNTARLVAKKLQAFAQAQKTIGPFTQKKIHADLAHCAHNFALHLQQCQLEGRKVVDVETRFGYFDSDSEPLELTTDKYRYLVRGRIDRVDARGDALYVLDYKTGKSKNYQADTLDGGKKLQPPIYAEAASKLFPGYSKVFSGYLAVKDSHTESAPLHDAGRLTMLNDIIDFIFDSMKAGVFMQQAHCTFCPYTAVCGERVDMSLARKADPVQNSATVAGLLSTFQHLQPRK